jgi:hypothetical protein
MVRRGPASVCTRKSRSKRFSRIALTGSALRRACRMMMIRLGRSADTVTVRYHRPRPPFREYGAVLPRAPAAARLPFSGWFRGAREQAMPGVICWTC